MAHSINLRFVLAVLAVLAVLIVLVMLVAYNGPILKILDY